jgi:hypothetical protein
MTQSVNSKTFIDRPVNMEIGVRMHGFIHGLVFASVNGKCKCASVNVWLNEFRVHTMGTYGDQNVNAM